MEVAKRTNRKSIVEYAPYWGRAELSQYGLSQGTKWIVSQPEKPNSYGNTARETAYLLAINNYDLLEEVFKGPGKQPHPSYRAGFLEVAPINEITLSRFHNLFVVLDEWTGRPFAGHVLMETSQEFDLQQAQTHW